MFIVYGLETFRCYQTALRLCQKYLVMTSDCRLLGVYASPDNKEGSGMRGALPVAVLNVVKVTQGGVNFYREAGRA